MKDYMELINVYKLVIWDGKDDIKCVTGTFSADEIKRNWNIRDGIETFYIIKGKNRSAASYYGTNLSNNYDTEDVLECGIFTVKDFVEEEYRKNLTDNELFVECPIELIQSNLKIIDQRI